MKKKEVVEVGSAPVERKRKVRKIIAGEWRGGGFFPVEGFPEVTTKSEALAWCRKVNEAATEPKVIEFYKSCGSFRVTPQMVMNFEVV